MSNYIEIKYPKNSFKKYQKDILCQNQLELFFKMAFINLENYTFAIADTENFVSMLSVENINPYYLLKIVAEIIEKMIEAENRYLYIGEYKIDARYIMCSTIDKSVMMFYVPYVYRSKKEIVDDIKRVILDIARNVPVKYRTSGVLNRALDFIELSGNDLRLISCKFNRMYFNEKKRV